ncbi:cupin domain-containing protein [bacterium]|nr:cupin domain-containing protein [bacterium]
MQNIIKKPWGQEEILELNDKYMLKRLTMLQGCRCSLQYHNKKRETIYVLSGELKIIQGTNKQNLNCNIYKTGDVITIEPKIIHRMEAAAESVYLEASTPDTDDTVRIEDDYNR